MDEKKNPASAEEAARLKKEADESRRETFYMMTAVVGTIVFISGLMVSSPVTAIRVMTDEDLSWSLPGLRAHVSTLPWAKLKRRWENCSVRAAQSMRARLWMQSRHRITANFSRMRT